MQQRLQLWLLLCTSSVSSFCTFLVDILLRCSSSFQTYFKIQIREIRQIHNCCKHCRWNRSEKNIEKIWAKCSCYEVAQKEGLIVQHCTHTQNFLYYIWFMRRYASKRIKAEKYNWQHNVQLFHFIESVWGGEQDSEGNCQQVQRRDWKV